MFIINSVVNIGTLCAIPTVADCSANHYV